MSQSSTEAKLVTHTNPSSPLSEAYRALRTNIQFSGIDERIQTLMVASAQSGDGKSTSVSNLAIAYAQEGKQVLLIDGDLRKPSLHHMFLLSNRIGLTNVLLSGQSWKQSVRETHVPNLSVMPAGAIPPNPSEILASQKMKTLMDELRESFDIILFDTPPILAVSDGLIVSSMCDGVVIVVNSGKTRYAAAKKLQQNLDRAKAKVLGVVLNNVKRKGDDGYYYNYYAYGSNAKKS